MSVPATDVTLVVSDGESETETAPQSTDADKVVRFDVSGLDPDTEYTYVVKSTGLAHGAGRFRTLPTAGQPASFMVAFSGDADTNSSSPIFASIAALNPLMFIHMGDLHYENNSTNSQALFHAAFDRVFRTRQAELYANVSTEYVWDDHCYGGDNSNGSTASKPAAAAVYRSRVPHYTLLHATAIYQTWDIGRVRFILTDQRSEASSNAAADNSSKTMLGATQKAWFKNIISNSPGMLLVWICPRWFGNANHIDSWNSFSTERTELCDHIKANAPGRVIVLSADQHYTAIDSGVNVDHATGGGCPLPTFQCAPLDRSPSALGGTWTHGVDNTNGQFGTMTITDSGGSTIGVAWQAHKELGPSAIARSFTVSV